MATVGYRRRKNIRLKGYDYSKNGFYYVTVCTHNRQPLFSTQNIDSNNISSTHHSTVSLLPVGATPCGRPFPDNAECTAPQTTHFISPAQMVEKWLLKLETKFPDVSVCEYVIMSDHMHFIISRKNEIADGTGDHAGSPLQGVVGWFKTMTTNEYINGVKNGRYPSFDKKIWQRGYYEHIIRDSNDYKIISDYIAANPICSDFENNALIGNIIL